MTDNTSSIKRAQKESLLQREISRLLMAASLDDSRLSRLMITRIKLSPDKSTCSIYCYPAGGHQEFLELLEVLKLYKPSLRTALARSINARYTPELIFKFDDQYEKEEKINQLFEDLKQKGEL